MPITRLNRKLKILIWVLANRLQLVISDLIEPEQDYAMKGKSIQDSLHLMHEMLERIDDINLDQSKAFDRMDHRFFATVLENAGFKPPSSGAGERQALGGFRDRAVGQADLALVSSFLCLRFGVPAP